ncbi:AraC family transcriptional regulator [Pontibacterium sp.]|uniref:AraC family transcriptional regulator n=1 Tax=Pontibacterium sp. TaxID=2036026 RepID=UPI003561F808
MSTPSSWPLPPESIRFVIPRRVISELAQHPLSSGLYPLGMGYYRQATGHHMERDVHDDNLLIYCLDGEGDLEAGGKKHRVRPGDILLIPKGIPHSYKARRKNPWTIYWVHFHGHHASDFVQHLALPRSDQPHLVMPIGIHSRLVSDFEALLEARESTYNINAYICAANQLRQIMAHIALLQPLARHKQSGDGIDIERVHSLMQARAHEQLDLDTLAETVNLSKYHFVKKYKEITGTTPINHFIQLKIERACHLLDTTNNSINEIAFAVGYEDAYYFSRIFKKLMGVSPSQYRKMRTGAYPYKGD